MSASHNPLDKITWFTRSKLLCQNPHRLHETRNIQTVKERSANSLPNEPANGKSLFDLESWLAWPHDPVPVQCRD